MADGDGRVFFLKFPWWVFACYVVLALYHAGCVAWFAVGGGGVAVDGAADPWMIAVAALGAAGVSFGLVMVIRVNVFDAYRYTINGEGISVDEAGFVKKRLSWDADLYYVISRSYFGCLDWRKYRPLRDGFAGGDAAAPARGWLMIKTKRVLRRVTDSKDLICVPGRWLKYGATTRDVVERVRAAMDARFPSAVPPAARESNSAAGPLTGKER